MLNPLIVIPSGISAIIVVNVISSCSSSGIKSNIEIIIIVPVAIAVLVGVYIMIATARSRERQTGRQAVRRTSGTC